VQPTPEAAAPQPWAGRLNPVGISIRGRQVPARQCMSHRARQCRPERHRRSIIQPRVGRTRDLPWFTNPVPPRGRAHDVASAGVLPRPHQSATSAGAPPKRTEY
jgi:hypothetical protein